MLGDEGCWRRHDPPHSLVEVIGTKALAEGFKRRSSAGGVGPSEDDAADSTGGGEVEPQDD